jgi:hypothetical protein
MQVNDELAGCEKVQCLFGTFAAPLLVLLNFDGSQLAFSSANSR